MQLIDDDELMLAPAGTPQPIIDKINKAMRTAIAEPVVMERISASGAEGVAAAVASTPEEYGKIIDSDLMRRGALIKKLNLSIN